MNFTLISFLKCVFVYGNNINLDIFVVWIKDKFFFLYIKPEARKTLGI